MLFGSDNLFSMFLFEEKIYEQFGSDAGVGDGNFG
jgi:hypothetical protein